MDALRPDVISDLIEKEILDRLDGDLWEYEVRQEQEGKDQLRQISDNFGVIREFLNPEVNEATVEGWIFE